MAHTYQSIERLNQVASGPGGALLAVVGAGRSLYAGLGRPKATTLFEAVLTFLAGPDDKGDERHYQQVMIITSSDSDDGHLPTLDLGSLVVGDTPAIWLLRGADSGPESRPPEQTQAPGQHSTMLDLGSLAEEEPTWFDNSVILTASGMSWAERMEKAWVEMESRCGVIWGNGQYSSSGQPPQGRTLFLIDEWWLYPHGRMDDVAFTHGDDARKRGLANRFKKLPEHLAQGRADLVVLCSDRRRAEALARGGYLHTILGDELKQAPERTKAMIPNLGWDNVELVQMPCQEPDAPWGAWLPGASASDKLYDVLRFTPPAKEVATLSGDPWSGPRMRELAKTAKEELGKIVKGQDPALDAVYSRLIMAAAGLSSVHRGNASPPPRATWIFAGPTGVGKTQLAEALAAFLFGDRDKMIRLDMGEFTDEFSLARLFGAPAHLRGEGGQLTQFVEQNPYCVVLFDEIEKAHRNVYKNLLGLLDAGRMTDAHHQRDVDFSNCLIIMTSNLGAGDIRPGQTYQEIQRSIHAAIEHFYRYQLGMPEFLGKLGFPDNAVVFDGYKEDVAKEIFELCLEGLRQKVAAKHGISVEIEEPSLDFLRHYCIQNKGYGYRDIGKHLVKALGDPLADQIVNAEVQSNHWLVHNLRQDGEKFTLEVRPLD